MQQSVKSGYAPVIDTRFLRRLSQCHPGEYAGVGEKGVKLAGVTATLVEGFLN